MHHATPRSLPVTRTRGAPKIQVRRLQRHTKFITSTTKVAAYFAMYAIRQSPYPWPDGLEPVVRHLQKKLDLRVKRDPKASGLMKLHGMFKIAEPALETLLMETLKPHRVFQKWNRRQNGNRAPLGITSRYDLATPSDPDDDFIDLYALCRNVARGVADEEIRDEDGPARPRRRGSR